MSEEAQNTAAGWTVDTLRIFVQREFADFRLLLDERYASQTKAIDAAFLAQQTAMHTAFAAADKAVDKALLAAEKALEQRAATLDREFHEHLAQVRHENALAFQNSDKAIAAALASAKDATSSALTSSKEAVTKAEIANEKRFESVNEFRAQLADQAATFVSRTEAQAYRDATDNKMESLKELLDKVDKRLDITAGRNAGSASTIGYAVTAIGVLILIINFVFFIISR